MFGKINISKTRESLLVRNEIIDKLEKELKVRFSYSFNDLYGVKGGVVRRLKGGLYSDEMFERGGYFCDRKMFNELFNKVKEFVENLEYEGFKIELNKRIDYTWGGYRSEKKRGYEGNWFDYKEKSIYEEGTLILKIRWDV
jgi:hypothetical protein